MWNEANFGGEAIRGSGALRPRLGRQLTTDNGQRTTPDLQRRGNLRNEAIDGLVASCWLLVASEDDAVPIYRTKPIFGAWDLKVVCDLEFVI